MTNDLFNGTAATCVHRRPYAAIAFGLPALRHRILQASLLLLFIVSGSACSAQDSADYRIWTTVDRRKSNAKLTLVESDGKSVKLQREDNGEVLTLKVEQLSRGDRQFLRGTGVQLAKTDGSSQRAGSSPQGNWPRFRGPNGAGVSDVKGLPDEWSDDKNIRWKTPLPGPGLSSPVVWGNNVYVTCFTGFEWPKENNQKRRVGPLTKHLVCVDLRTGRIKWQRLEESKHYDPNDDLSDVRLAGHGHASNTPTCDERGVYAFFGADGMFAYSHDGELRWRKSCGEGYNRTGTASSPFADDGLVLVNATLEGGGLLAFDATKGEIIWKGRGNAGYDTPAMRWHDGQKEIVVRNGDDLLRGMNPKTGEVFWSVDGKDASHTSIVATSDMIFSMGYKTEVFGRNSKGEIQWELTGGPYYATPVYFEGHLYYVSSIGVFTCVKVETGQVAKRQRLPTGGSRFASPVIADGKFYSVTREQGTVVVDIATNEVLAHNTISADDSYFDGTPAVTASGLILRSNRNLYCVGKK